MVFSHDRRNGKTPFHRKSKPLWTPHEGRVKSLAYYAKLRGPVVFPIPGNTIFYWWIKRSFKETLREKERQREYPDPFSKGSAATLSGPNGTRAATSFPHSTFLKIDYLIIKVVARHKWDRFVTRERV